MLGETAEVGTGANSNKGNLKTATLDEFGTNLTKLASESKLRSSSWTLFRNRSCSSNIR